MLKAKSNELGERRRETKEEREEGRRREGREGGERGGKEERGEGGRKGERERVRKGERERVSNRLNILRLVFMLTSCQWRNQQQPRGDQTWSATLLHSRPLHKGIVRNGCNVAVYKVYPLLSKGYTGGSRLIS